MRPCSHRLVSIAVAVVTVTACTFLASCGPLSRPAGDRDLFTIDPNGPWSEPSSRADARPTAAASGGAALRVRRLQVVNPYAGTAFVYRTAGGAFRTDYYNGFIAPPAELLTGAFVDRLSRSGGFVTVVDSTSSVPARYVLEGSVTALYGDYTDRSAPKAVISMRIFVLDEKAVGSRLAFQKEYRAAAPIKPASAPSLVDGWNRAANTILDQVVADLRSGLAPETREQQALTADAG